jgi:ABC-type nitrate/sulfonate/bicarbonate transport system substrate-binding protein
MTRSRISNTTSASKGTDSPIELWYSRCGAATASAIAIRKNWLPAEFSKGGTRLRSLRDSGEGPLLDAHYHHRLTGLFREGGNIPPIWARARGEDTRVLGITWLDEYQGILVREDSSIRSVADLPGKRLALPRHDNLIDFQRGAAQHGFVTALGLAGAVPDPALFIDVLASGAVGRRSAQQQGRVPPRQAVEVEALLEGRVDAIFLRFARGVRVARDPRFREVINLNDHPDPRVRVNNGTPRPITVDGTFLERHPELVVRYLAVLLRTAAWAEQHRDEVLELLVSEGGAESVAEVIASHGPNVHAAFTPKLTSGYLDGLEQQKNFLRDHGYLQADFDVRSWVASEPLRQAEAIVSSEPSASESGHASRQLDAVPTVQVAG